jgi:hypothetical protein
MAGWVADCAAGWVRCFDAKPEREGMNLIDRSMP